MILYYIQDSVGADTPIAPFAKATPTNILAYTLKIYRNDELRQVNHYDYIAAQGKHLCRTKTCTRSLEYESEYVRNKKGILTKVITTHTNGKREVSSMRRTMKYEDTYTDGYLTCRNYPNAKLTKNFRFSKGNSVYLEMIDLEYNEMTKWWEHYDRAGRVSSVQYICHEKDNPADILYYESYIYFYEDYNDKDSRLSHVIGMVRYGDFIRSVRDVFSDYDEQGNWRTKHHYEMNHEFDSEEKLKNIEKREIAYSEEQLQAVEDAYGEAAYLINLDEYTDTPKYEDYPF